MRVQFTFFVVLISLFTSLSSYGMSLDQLDCQFMPGQNGPKLVLDRSENHLSSTFQGKKAVVHLVGADFQIIGSIRDEHDEVLTFATLDVPTANRRSILQSGDYTIWCYLKNQK